MRIQRAWTRLQLSRGRVIKGHKIGLTSKAMQNAVGISEPDYGVLFAGHVLSRWRRRFRSTASMRRASRSSSPSS